MIYDGKRKRQENSGMETKNYAEVLIDGRIYTLGGAEEQEYLQKVAAYINDKIVMLKSQPGFTRQSPDYQEVMIQLNLADDYFKALQEAKAYKAQKEEMEREMYSLKHELISAQMRLDALSAKGDSEGKE
jgi:cell division protein ZapA